MPFFDWKLIEQQGKSWSLYEYRNFKWNYCVGYIGSLPYVLDRIWHDLLVPQDRIKISRMSKNTKSPADKLAEQLELELGFLDQTTQKIDTTSIDEDGTTPLGDNQPSDAYFCSVRGYGGHQDGPAIQLAEKQMEFWIICKHCGYPRRKAGDGE